MNSYEDEVIKFTQNAELNISKKSEDAWFFFNKLMTVFPYVGSKIDWKKVTNHVGDKDNEIDFFLRIKSKFSLTGSVIYIGDSVTDFALIGSVEDMIKISPNLLSIPQHHYFLDENFLWCFCFTTEGDVDFGFAQFNG